MMTKLSVIIEAIEKTAIPCGAAAWDKSGMQVASRRDGISTLAVALDPTPDTISRAVQAGAQMVLTHHPLTMKPRFLDVADAHHQVVAMLLSGDIALYGAHTSLDANPQGPVGWLGRALDLAATSVLEPTCRQERVSHLVLLATPLPEALSASELMLAHRAVAGGHIITCDAANWPALRTLLQQHTTAAVIPVAAELPPNQLGIGMVGDLAQPQDFATFLNTLATLVPLQGASICGAPPAMVRRVAYCTGSGSSLADDAFRHGADVFITGDVKYHAALDTRGCIIDVGHFSLEEEMMRRFATQLAQELPALEVVFLPAQDPLRPLRPA